MQRRRGDQCITVWARIRHVNSGAAPSNRFVDGNHAIGEYPEHAIFEPRSQRSACLRIASLDTHHADFDLEN